MHQTSTPTRQASLAVPLLRKRRLLKRSQAHPRDTPPEPTPNETTTTTETRRKIPSVRRGELRQQQTTPGAPETGNIPV